MNACTPVIISAVRTPIGNFVGVSRTQTHAHLASIVMNEVCKRANFPKFKIEDIFWGVGLQTMDENGLARVAALKAGLPEGISAVQINRACCSGMEAIRIGSLAIRLGDAKAILAGGGECMRQVPPAQGDAGRGSCLHRQEPIIGPWDELTHHHFGAIIGLSAEKVAEEYGISRKDQDRFAYTSQMRARQAILQGKFEDEIVPVTLPGNRGKKETVVYTDEYSRYTPTMDDLTALKPIFKQDGTVTAGNASSIKDGASAVLILSHATANHLNITRQWRIVGSVAVGVDPSIMGIGPVPAIRKLLDKTGYSLEDIELFEINEAFAAASLAIERELGLNRDIVNVNGGGIALGYPAGNSGCRIVVSLIHEMQRRGLSCGLAALCGINGHGQAMIIERV